jgi:TolB-like protein/class 3 adenylate cyclase
MEDRRLAAIMFTDIVGYTALMGSDEKKAFEVLRKNRNIQKPIIKKYRGKWLKEMGDGILASFDTASDAVRCAGEIQNQAKREDIELRIGIHTGEVVFEGNDVLGDGVNVASRLEELAEKGCIYISGSVYKDIKNKVGIKAEFVEEKILKNVDEPVKIYALDIEGSETSKVEQVHILPNVVLNRRRFLWFISAAGLIIVSIITLVAVLRFNKADKKMTAPEEANPIIKDNSIAVLPFDDLSKDLDQEYICIGMMEAILSHLSKIDGLRLTSRTTMMTYEGSDKRIPEIARELAVRYVLEGSVLRVGDNVRITAQLIEGETDDHVWSEYYEGDLSDLFRIQSDVAKQIAEQLQINISYRTEENINAIPTQDSKAYDLYLQSLRLARTGDLVKWKEILDQVVQIDTTFAPGYAELGRYWLFRGFNDRDKIQIAEAYLNKAILLDPDIQTAHMYLSWLNLWLKWDFYTAEREQYYAQKIEPSNHENYHTDLYLSMGRYIKALEYSLKHIIAEPNTGHLLGQHALALYFNSRYEEARKMLEKTLKANREIQPGNFYFEAARTYLYLGEYDEVIRLLNDVMTEYQRSPHLLSFFCIAHHNLNHNREASELLLSLINLYGTKVNSPAFYIAMVYAQMNDIDQTFEWLEKSYQDHEVEMYWLKVEPPFEPLHNDPRWQVMLDKVGFPD